MLVILSRRLRIYVVASLFVIHFARCETSPLPIPSHGLLATAIRGIRCRSSTKRSSFHPDSSVAIVFLLAVANLQREQPVGQQRSARLRDQAAIDVQPIRTGKQRNSWFVVAHLGMEDARSADGT